MRETIHTPLIERRPRWWPSPPSTALRLIISDSIEANRQYMLVAGSFVIGSAALARIFDLPFKIGLSARFIVLSSILGFFVICGATAMMLFRDRPASPLSHLKAKLRGDWAITERMALGLPIVLATSFMFATFTSMKASIGNLVPYYADPILVGLDRAIHGGDAWKLIHPLIGYPLVTYCLGLFYFAWIPVVFMTLAAVAFMRSRRRLRNRYLLSVALCWILLGSLAAMTVASAGPCFYRIFYHDDPFREMSSYFDYAGHFYSMTHLDLQALLLREGTEPGVQIGNGISAFPSMHVALAFLNALFARHIGRVWFGLSIAFLVIILVGSVHLGWHYAIDGEASIIGVVAIWWLSDRLVGGIEIPDAHQVSLTFGST
ncbi:phosphatase PAP2 family protein [Mesorhizobium sp. LSJC285A00]|uniref:phosphatase PAP2 family protein n=1 Tax=Mesorhizobium sp. LSJC285A00 TaxID=1287338 RepID=UPI0018DC62C3|nr:phosphatase PAP2 family protein [Mesorhizobium sp. LSJC285A00]